MMQWKIIVFLQFGLFFWTPLLTVSLYFPTLFSSRSHIAQTKTQLSFFIIMGITIPHPFPRLKPSHKLKFQRFFHTPRQDSFFTTAVFCHNLVTIKHVATSTSILRNMELRVGFTASSGGSGGRRKRVVALSCRSARVCRLFFNNLYTQSY